MMRRSVVVLCLLAMACVLALPVAFAQGSGDWPPQTKADRIKWGMRKQAPVAHSSTVSSPEVAELKRRFNTELKVLPGHPMSCRNMLGGALKCCREAVPDAQEQWWTTYGKMMRSTSAEARACDADTDQGIYGSGTTVGDLRKPITSEKAILDGGGDPIACGQQARTRDVNERVLAYEKANNKEALNWSCNEQEYDLAVQRNLGECKYVGTRCATRVLGFCTVEQQVYCCFNSPMTRDMRSNLLQQGFGDLGTANNPTCGGVSPRTASLVELGKISTRNLVARMHKSGFIDNYDDWHNLEPGLTGSGSDIGNHGRKTLRERTADRVAQMDMRAASDSLKQEMSVTMPTEMQHAPTGPGQIMFASLPRGVSRGCDRWQLVRVVRNGGEGPVSVTVSMGADANPGWVYDAMPPTVLSWADGDTDAKTVKFFVHKVYVATNVPFVLSKPTGGATIPAPGRTTDITVGCTN